MKRIFLDLSSMEEKDLIQLYDTVKNKLVQRNGYVVDYNPALTAILGCHTNSLLLGSSEQAKAAAHYLGPYVDKDKTPLGETLEIIYEAMQYVKTHPSKAGDAGTISRFAQFLLTRILDKLGSLIEYSDTQAAAELIGLRTSISSEIFAGCDTDACINLVKNELFFNKETSRSCDNDDEEDCCSRPDEISDEESCLSDSFIEDDSKTWSKKNVLESLLQLQLLESSKPDGTSNNNSLLKKIQNTIAQSKTAMESSKTKFNRTGQILIFGTKIMLMLI